MKRPNKQINKKTLRPLRLSVHSEGGVRKDAKDAKNEKSLNVLHLCRIARFGIGLFVGITDGYDVV